MGCLQSECGITRIVETGNKLPICGKCKVVLVLNEVPHHEDVCWSGGISPRILNLGAKLR